jgi:hypothetical protein
MEVWKSEEIVRPPVPALADSEICLTQWKEAEGARGNRKRCTVEVKVRRKL